MNAVAGLALAMALGACGSQPDQPVPKAPVADTAKPKPLSQRDPEAYKRNVEGAMHEVAKTEQQQVQQIIVCTVRKNNAARESKPLTAEMIRAIVAQVKADPQAAAAACQQ